MFSNSNTLEDLTIVIEYMRSNAVFNHIEGTPYPSTTVNIHTRLLFLGEIKTFTEHGEGVKVRRGKGNNKVHYTEKYNINDVTMLLDKYSIDYRTINDGGGTLIAPNWTTSVIDEANKYTSTL